MEVGIGEVIGLMMVLSRLSESISWWWWVLAWEALPAETEVFPVLGSRYLSKGWGMAAKTRPMQNTCAFSYLSQELVVSPSLLLAKALRV